VDLDAASSRGPEDHAMGLFGDEGKSKPPATPTAKPKADFSNVKAGSSSTAPPPAEAPEEKSYVVKPGDSLSKIAKAQYGNANQWKKIYDANRDRIHDPDLIQPGWKLRIPE
jgi:nucleoid-associated protein YgaU